jgi:hypothetical protein
MVSARRSRVDSTSRTLLADFAGLECQRLARTSQLKNEASATR